MVIGKHARMSERNPEHPDFDAARTTGATPPNPPGRGDPPPWRVGHGYDLHRLDVLAPAGEGRPLVVGGVRIESDRGPVAHSDGDALLHAITDALLGACALPDLGTLFPDNDPANESRDSVDFLRDALERARDAGYRPVNVDATVVLERPRLKSRRDEIRGAIASVLGLDQGAVNLKGKSHEGLDAIGEGRAIEAHAIVLVARA